MPSAAPLQAAIRRSVLTMRATVWARTGNTGAYNNAVKTGLACRLDNVTAVSPSATTSERAEAAAHKTLMFDASYAMPEQGIQIEVTSPAYYAGKRWNPVANTVKAEIPPGYDAPISATIDVRRAT